MIFELCHVSEKKKCIYIIKWCWVSLSFCVFCVVVNCLLCSSIQLADFALVFLGWHSWGISSVRRRVQFGVCPNDEVNR